MKSPKHNENLKSFVRKVLKESKKAEIAQIDGLRAVVRGALTYDLPESKAEEALAVIDREFVDLNELRVATELELQDMLGEKYPEIEKRAMKMVAILNAIFEKEGTLTLERVKTLGKKEIRQYFRELPEMTPYIEAYVMLHAFEYAAVPVDDELMALVIDAEGADEQSTIEEVQKSLENILKSEDVADFHVGVRKLIGGKKKK